jgi:hypothetical protein
MQKRDVGVRCTDVGINKRKYLYCTPSSRDYETQKKRKCGFYAELSNDDMKMNTNGLLVLSHHDPKQSFTFTAV